MISDQVAQYRLLNAQSKELKAQIDVLRSKIEQEVETHGNFEDDAGYAKIVSRDSSTSCKNAKGLHEQATIWAESDDPTMQASGKTVLTYLTSKSGYTYLVVK